MSRSINYLKISQNSSPIMKALDQSLILNNFLTHFQFSKDLGTELLKGSATDEHIEVLQKSMDGIEQFLDLLTEKLEERKAK